MTSSLITLSTYGALFLAVLLAPYASIGLGFDQGRAPRTDWLAAILILGGAVILTVARGGLTSVLSLFILIPLIGSGVRPLLGGIAAALLFATVTWWEPAARIGPISTAVAAMLALAAGFLPRWTTPSRPAPGPLLAWNMLLCLLVGLAVGLLTAPFEASEPIHIAWHHWGAYLSPVEAWLGGGVPYRDFPVQYGIGPTTLLLASCGRDCWTGMYWVSISANALYFATLCGGVILLTARSSRGVRWLAWCAMFCATFIWTGFPINLAGPAMTPSVGGLRFLAVSALLFYILLAEERQVRRDWIGHALWLIALFWSPEAAFFGTAIWWPYLALRSAGDAGGIRPALLALVRVALRAIGALIIGLCALGLTLWLLSAKTVTAEQFFAYILHPPGPLPVNPYGTVWIALASVALALPMLLRQGLSAQARPFYVCLLGFMAAGSYFISRSHDNNILNLFPLLILVLLAIRERTDTPPADFARAFITTMLVAMIAFVATFHFGSWQEGARRAGLLTMGPARLIARFTPHRSDDPAIVAPDAAAALDYLRGRNGGMVLLFDDRWLLPRAVSGTSWTGVNNAANFEPLPRPMIAHYIQRGAAAYRQPGWIVVGPGFGGWAKAFQRAYDVREEKSFGAYRAYYLVPRLSSGAGQSGRLAALALDRAKPKLKR